jgi:radical SAM superfamily enzyme YgiQ (UPF0313 family)
MRVLFIEGDTVRSWAVSSLGPAFIAAYLRQHGHEVSFFRAGADMTEAEVVARVREQDPGLIGVSLTTRQWLRGRALVAAIRAELEVPVAAGGLHPTFSPEQVLSCAGFDYVCLGEGEAGTLELVEALERGQPTDAIRNIWKAGAPRPGLRPPFEPIDSLPFMARDLLDEYNGCVHVTTQRGCPFPCTYCGARQFHDLYQETDAKYGRRRSHENVLEELRQIRRDGALAYVIFLDDTFTIHHPWVKEFCRVYSQEFPDLGFSLHARVETVNERMLHQLAAAGCKHITYGVESGSQRVRTDIMRRPVSNERFKEVFAWTREAGIMVTANYMLGIPGETRDDLQQTLDLAEELEAFDFGYFVFYPYPGTQLFRVCQDEGYLPDDHLALPANHRESILRLPHISQADIGEFYDEFTALRERLYRARLDPASSQESQDADVQHVRDMANSG